MKWLLACGLAVAPLLGAVSQEPDRLSDEALLAYLGNMQIEARLDADVTSDGRTDAVYVASNRNERVLGLIAGGEDPVRIGLRVIADGALDPSPEVPVVLGFDDGVLTVEDQSGAEDSDLVTLSRYRYRYDPSRRRMRLSALVCEQYSPTLGQASHRISWDLESGDQVVEHGRVVTMDSGEDVYVYESAIRTSRKMAAVYLEEAPSPRDLLASDVTQQTVSADGSSLGAQSP